jgi:hypothetical protein
MVIEFCRPQLTRRVAVRAFWRFLTLLTLFTLGFASQARAQSREFDDWARFKPGSWCELRTKSQTVSPQGAVASESVAQSTISVVDVSEKAVTLRIASGMTQYEGKSFPTPETVLVLRPHGQTDQEKLEVSELPKANVRVGDVDFACRVRQAELTGPQGKRIVTTSFRDAAPQSPLRRIEKLLDENGDTVHTTTTEVIALDMPYPFAEKIQPVSFVRTIYKNQKLNSTTVTVSSADVPGQIVSMSSNEQDANGKLQRRVTQELIDFNVATKDTIGTAVRTRIKQRREERRNRAAEKAADQVDK